MAAAVVAALLVPAASGADSFTPVTLATRLPSIARRHAPLGVTVVVTADAGVLDGSEGPLRIEVKLAPECGGSFQTTPGDTLLNAALTPQPTTGRPYVARASGAGRPSAFGIQTVCVFLEDTDVGRVYASDQSLVVDVSPACTTAAARFDGAAAALRRAHGRLRRTPRSAQRRRRALERTITRERRVAARDRAAAARACGARRPL